MSVASPQAASLWESAGQRAAPSLRGVSIAAVLGADTDATAAVALGLARSQSQRRRVVLCDLFDEGSAVSRLIADDDATGVSDVIEYGVSFGYAARHADRVGNLLIVPPGHDTPLTAAVLEHPRWQRIAAEFRDADALLLLAVPANAPAVRPLLELVDGVITVDAPASAAGPARVLAEVTRTVRRTPTSPTPPAAAVPPPESARRTPPARERSSGWSSSLIGLGAAAALMLVAYFAFSRSEAPLPGSESRPAEPAAVTRDTLGVINPADAGRAAAFSVEVSATNTTFGAFDALRTWSAVTPAVTFVAAQQGDSAAVWYRIRLGAFERPSEATAFADSVRTNFDSTTGNAAVIRTPFAFVIDSAQSALARDLVETYRQRGIPAYGLADSNELVRIYVGAFESPLDAERMRESLIAASITPSLAYRVGRPH